MEPAFILKLSAPLSSHKPETVRERIPGHRRASEEGARVCISLHQWAHQGSSPLSSTP